MSSCGEGANPNMNPLEDEQIDEPADRNTRRNRIEKYARQRRGGKNVGEARRLIDFTKKEHHHHQHHACKKEGKMAKDTVL